MADGVELNAGTGGATVATDDDGTFHHQYVKVEWGADNTQTKVTTGAASLPVQGAAAHDAAVAANPMLVAAYASAAAPTAVSADGDAVRIWADLEGRVQVGDGGATLSVDDGGASLTIDGSVSLAAAIPAGNNNIGDVDVASLPALPAGTNNIGDVDVLSVVPGTGATALGKAEDAAAASGDTGVAVLAVRRDTPSSGVADGDYANLSVDADGALRVSGAVAATQYTEDAASAGGESLTLAGAVRQDTPAGSAADGDYVNLKTDSVGRLWVNASGAAVPVTDNGGSLTVDGSVSLGAAIPAGNNNIGDVDIASVPAPLSTTGGGTEAAALRVTIATDSTGVLSVDDNGSTLSIDDGGGAITVDGSVSLAAAIPAGTNNIGDVDVLSLPALPAGTNNIGDVDVLTLPGVTGAAAHDSAVSGNPVLLGIEARTSDGTAVSSGDAVRVQGDVFGKQVVLVGGLTEHQVRGTLNRTDNNAADVIAAQGAGIKIAVMGILVTNAHATVSTKVTIRTATTSRVVGYAVAAGGGFCMSGGGVPIFITGANEAVTAICGTTGSDIDITVWGVAIKN